MRSYIKRHILFTLCFVVVTVALYFVYIRQLHGRSHKYHIVNGSTVPTDVKLARPPKVLDHQALIPAANDIFKQKGVVLFSMINDAYYNFTASWCCNTASLGNVHEHVLFLTSDQNTGQRLKDLWPEITVVSLNGSQYNGQQEYSRAGYVRMMVGRTRFILRLLEAGIRVLLFEVDCLWLTNPLPGLLSRQGEGDMLVTRVTGTDVTAGGFMLMNPTTATVKLWQSLTRSMEDLHHHLKKSRDSAQVSEALNDQQFFTGLIKKKYGGIKPVYLNSDQFTDGKWYQMSEKTRSAKPRPVIINNNWLVGNAAKIRRAKTFGHWFLNEDGKTCNLTAFHKLTL